MAPAMGMGGGTAAKAPAKKKKKKKAKLKPKTKMKPLHWTKFNLKKSKGTIFETMDEEECREQIFGEIGEEDFVKLFGIPKKKKKEKKKKKKEGDGDGKKKKKKKNLKDLVTFIDGAKNQKIGIALGRFKINPYQTRIHILHLN